jgi:3-methyladenine DNA glycosylase AlkD
MEYEEILSWMKSRYNKKNIQGMARYGINVRNAYGISMPALRKKAKQAGRDHRLAGRLWGSGMHEARILACLIDDPELVTERQMEKWVRDFDSWDICDQCCSNLFDKTEFAWEKAFSWSERKEDFVKRAGFVLMAVLSVHDKKKNDRDFLRFLPVIKRHSSDERNFVRKAVNWALRQIGKRSSLLNREAIKTAKDILLIDSKAAKWVAGDALRELSSAKVREKVKRR